MQTLDKQIVGYLPSLGANEKKTILSVIKSFVSLKKKSTERISIEDYNKELNEAMERVRKGEYSTQEEVEKEAQNW